MIDGDRWNDTKRKCQFPNDILNHFVCTEGGESSVLKRLIVNFAVCHLLQSISPVTNIEFIKFAGITCWHFFVNKGLDAVVIADVIFG